MAERRESPTLAEWWDMDGMTYEQMRRIVGVVNSRVAGLALDRGFRRGRGSRSGRWSHGPCLGAHCEGSREPVPVEELDGQRRCSRCRVQPAAAPVDLAAERRRSLERTHQQTGTRGTRMSAAHA